MKILIANSIFHPNVIGGAEGATYLLARQLSEAGLQVDVLATTGRRRGSDSGLTQRKLDGIAGIIHEAACCGLYDLLPTEGQSPPNVLIRGAHHFLGIHSRRWLQLARRALATSRPDVMHTHTIVGMTPAIWQAACEERVPVVHTLHDYHLLCPRTTLLRSSGHTCERPPLPCRLLAHRKLAATRHVRAVTAPSRYVLQRHLQVGGFGQARAEVVPNACIEVPARTPDRSRRTGLQGLYLGQIDGHKGIPVLLAALERLLNGSEPPGFSFAFAGAGPLVDAVKTFCSAHADRCRYHGVVRGQAKEELLADSSFVVLPSLWHDNFPMVILEAFHSGIPVIGSRRGGIPEIIDDDVCGQVIEPAVEALTAALKRYAENPALCREHGRAALAKVDTYSVERHVASFRDIYRNVGAGR